MVDNVIRRNEAEASFGGGIYAASPVRGNMIGANKAARGGGIHVAGDGVTIHRNRILANRAAIGGGLHLGVPATITNNTIDSNVADDRGGGMYAGDPPRHVDDPGIAARAGRPRRRPR